jgi:hypothetical protein
VAEGRKGKSSEPPVSGRKGSSPWGGGEYDLVGLASHRRRSGGGPGKGCARRTVGTYLYLHAGGASNPLTVLGLAR